MAKKHEFCFTVILEEDFGKEKEWIDKWYATASLSY